MILAKDIKNSKVQINKYKIEIKVEFVRADLCKISFDKLHTINKGNHITRFGYLHGLIKTTFIKR